MKTALITGITGQDGAYLSELLLSKGYVVHGIKRRSSLINTGRVDQFYDNPNFHLHYGDITDFGSVLRLIGDIKPDEIYHLAAQSHVKVSFDMPQYTVDTIVTGTLNVLEAVRSLDLSDNVRIYVACSSEMFGDVLETPQTELTPFNPVSPYACAKVFAFNIAKNYRKSYGMFVSNGILHNHESPLRGETFVTRKITLGLARIFYEQGNILRLGNLDAKRDWGHARDYVKAMWLMLQHNEPDDFVIATGETHSVREFLELSFSYLNLNWKEYVVIDPKYFRPSEVNLLLGNATKAHEKLGWYPKTSFIDLIKEMVNADLHLVREELYGKGQ